MDGWVLEQMLDNKDIDTKNVAYDFDFTKEFTWEFRDLVEIKKRRRYVLRTYKPTFKVLQQVKSALAFEKARKRGQLVSLRKPYQGYDLYEYFPDTDPDQVEMAKKQTIQHDLNVNNAGKVMRKEKVNDENDGGRRVKSRPTFSMA